MKNNLIPLIQIGSFDPASEKVYIGADVSANAQWSYTMLAG